MYPSIKEKYSRIALYGKDNYRHSEMINLKMLMASLFYFFSILLLQNVIFWLK